MGQQDEASQLNWVMLGYIEKVCAILSQLTTLLVECQSIHIDLPIDPAYLRSFESSDAIYARWMNVVFYEKEFEETMDSLQLFLSSLELAVAARTNYLEGMLDALHADSNIKASMDALRRNISCVFQGAFAVYEKQPRHELLSSQSRRALNDLMGALTVLPFEVSGMRQASGLFFQLDRLTSYVSQFDFLDKSSSVHRALVEQFQFDIQNHNFFQKALLLEYVANDYLHHGQPLTLAEENMYRAMIKGLKVSSDINSIVVNNFLNQRSPCRALVKRLKEKAMLSESLKQQLAHKDKAIGVVTISPPRVRVSVLEHCNQLKNLSTDKPIQYLSGVPGEQLDVLFVVHQDELRHELVLILLRDATQDVFHPVCMSGELEPRDVDLLTAYVNKNMGAQYQLSTVKNVNSEIKLSVEDWAQQIGELAVNDLLSVEGLKVFNQGLSASKLDQRLQQSAHEHRQLQDRLGDVIKICREYEKEIDKREESILLLESQVYSKESALKSARRDLEDQALRLEEIKQALSIAQGTIDSLKGVIASLEDQIKTMSAEGECLVDAEAEAKKISVTAIQDAQILQDELERMQAELARKQAELENRQGLEGRLNQVNIQVHDLLDQLDVQQAQVARQQRPKSMYQQSLSWADESAMAPGGLSDEVGSHAQAVELSPEKTKMDQLEKMAGFLRQLYEFQQVVFDEKITPKIFESQKSNAKKRLERMSEAFKKRRLLQRVFNGDVKVDYSDLTEKADKLTATYESALARMQKLSGDMSDCFEPLVKLVTDFSAGQAFSEEEYQRISSYVAVLVAEQLDVINALFSKELVEFPELAKMLRLDMFKHLSDDFVQTHARFPVITVEESQVERDLYALPITKDKLFHIATELLSLSGEALLNALVSMQPQASWDQLTRHFERSMKSVVFVYEWAVGNRRAQLDKTVADEMQSISAKYDLQQSLELASCRGDAEHATSLESMARNRESISNDSVIAAQSHFVVGHTASMHQYQKMLYLLAVSVNAYAIEASSERDLTEGSAELQGFISVYQVYLRELYKQTVSMDTVQRLEALDLDSEAEAIQQLMKQLSQQQVKLNNFLDALKSNILDCQQPVVSAFVGQGLALFPAMSRVLGAQRKDLSESMSTGEAVVVAGPAQ